MVDPGRAIFVSSVVSPLVERAVALSRLNGLIAIGVECPLPIVGAVTPPTPLPMPENTRPRSFLILDSPPGPEAPCTA